jgi:hypothetical protein
VDERDRLIDEVAELRRKCERGETTLQQVQVALARIESDLRYLKESSDDFITRAEHTPVRNIVYGVVGLIGASLVGVLMAVLFGVPK